MTEQYEDQGVSSNGSKHLAKEVKLKLNLSMPAEHPLSVFQNTVKERGIKSVDLSDVLMAALDQVPQAWWDSRVEDLTPLEFRVNAALADPSLREKLAELLASGSARPN